MKPIEIKILAALEEVGVFAIKTFELFDCYGHSNDSKEHTPLNFRKFLKSHRLSYIFKEGCDVLVY